MRNEEEESAREREWEGRYKDEKRKGN